MDGFPDAAATPHSGLAHPIHHPREQSGRRVNVDRVREWLDRLRPQVRFATPSGVRPEIRATNDCHKHCQQLAPTFRSVTVRIERGDFSLRSRTRCMARFHDAPHASATRPVTPRRRFLPRVRRFFDSADDLEDCVRSFVLESSQPLTLLSPRLRVPAPFGHRKCESVRPRTLSPHTREKCTDSAPRSGFHRSI